LLFILVRVSLLGKRYKGLWKAPESEEYSIEKRNLSLETLILNIYLFLELYYFTDSVDPDRAMNADPNTR
jgi:hypothetical protein